MSPAFVTRRCRSVRLSLLTTIALGVLGGACAAPVAGGAQPQRDRLIPPPPEPANPRLEPAGLTHLLRGMYFLKSGRAAAAVPHFRLALVYDTESAYIYEQLSRAWGLSGNRERSRAVLEVGLERVPEDAALSRLAGLLARGEFDYERAAGHLELAFQGDTTLADAAPALIDSLMWLGRVELARERAEDALTRRPRDADLALGLAGYFEDHGLLEDALKAYGAARVRRPSSLRAIFGELRVLELMGRYEAAADGLVPAFRFYPDNPSLFVRLYGLLHRAGRADAEAYRAEALRQTEGRPEGRVVVAGGDLLAGDRERGLELLEQTMEEHPGDPAARLYLADMFEQAGEPARCFEVLEAAEESERAAAAVLRARAWCHSGAGKLGAALDALVAWRQAGGEAGDVLLEGARVISRAPSEARAWALLADLRGRLGGQISPRTEGLAAAVVADAFGQGTRALALVRALVDGTPNDGGLRMRLADLEARYGEVASALTRLEALVREDGSDVVRLNALGYTLADAGQSLTRAEVWLRRAYRLAEEESFVIDSLGWLFYQRGQHEQALEFLERASRMTPGDPEVLFHLAQVLEKLGRSARARQALLRALRSHPPGPLRSIIERRLGELETGV